MDLRKIDPKKKEKNPARDQLQFGTRERKKLKKFPSGQTRKMRWINPERDGKDLKARTHPYALTQGWGHAKKSTDKGVILTGKKVYRPPILSTNNETKLLEDLNNGME